MTTQPNTIDEVQPLNIKDIMTEFDKKQRLFLTGKYHSTWFNSWFEETLTSLLAEKEREVINFAQAIIENDKTERYEYSRNDCDRNAFGKLPESGSRWSTPKEMAQAKIRQLQALNPTKQELPSRQATEKAIEQSIIDQHIALAKVKWYEELVERVNEEYPKRLLHELDEFSGGYGSALSRVKQIALEISKK